LRSFSSSVRTRSSSSGSRLLRAVLLHDVAHQRHVCGAAREDGDDVGLGGAAVVGRRSSVPELLLVDPVDPPAGALHDAGALERVRQQGVARSWGRDQQVVFAERHLGELGDAHPHETELDLLLAVARPEPSQELLGKAQQWPTEELVADVGEPT
jgi:hypothetical protein